MLYHLPQLLESIAAGRRVFVVEGEKDAHQLQALSFSATMNAQGAGKWRPEYSESPAGAHVVLLPDNDKTGRDHAQQVAAALFGVAADVRVVKLPHLPSKGDVSDWVAAGGTVQTLKELTVTAPEWEPGAHAKAQDPEPPAAPQSAVSGVAIYQTLFYIITV